MHSFGYPTQKEAPIHRKMIFVAVPVKTTSSQMRLAPQPSSSTKNGNSLKLEPSPPTMRVVCNSLPSAISPRRLWPKATCNTEAITASETMPRTTMLRCWRSRNCELVDAYLASSYKTLYSSICFALTAFGTRPLLAS